MGAIRYAVGHRLGRLAAHLPLKTLRYFCHTTAQVLEVFAKSLDIVVALVWAGIALGLVYWGLAELASQLPPLPPLVGAGIVGGVVAALLLRGCR
jgi:hypothetical protein